MDTKSCSKCEKVKPLSEFHKDKRAKDGLYAHCKECHYEMTHAYEQSEKGKEVIRKSLEKRKDQVREYHRQYSAQESSRQQRANYAKSEAGKAAQKRKDAKRKARYGYKLDAKTAVSNAVKSGIIPPITTQVCAECGEPAVEYHHESYNEEEWLHVTPLCKKHHAATYTNPH